MHPIPNPDHIFPLSQGSAERPAIRPPRLAQILGDNVAAVVRDFAPGREWAALKPIPLAAESDPRGLR